LPVASFLLSVVEWAGSDGWELVTGNWQLGLKRFPAVSFLLSVVEWAGSDDWELVTGN
jgi:hypothetical protein